MENVTPSCRLPGKFWIFGLSESVSDVFLRVKMGHSDTKNQWFPSHSWHTYKWTLTCFYYCFKKRCGLSLVMAEKCDQVTTPCLTVPVAMSLVCSCGCELMWACTNTTVVLYWKAIYKLVFVIPNKISSDERRCGLGSVTNSYSPHKLRFVGVSLTCWAVFTFHHNILFSNSNYCLLIQDNVTTMKIISLTCKK